MRIPTVKRLKFVDVASKRWRNLSSFLVPKKIKKTILQDNFQGKKIVAIVPTYKPLSTTVHLIENMLSWHENVYIILVDDSSPLIGRHTNSIRKIKNLAKNNARLTYIKTPHNLLKAAALNYGFSYIKSNYIKSDVIVTCDDDVVINKKTLSKMTETLFAAKNLGAVCGNVRVVNKNANLLTRLQGLEYNSFNIAKLADNGFFMGPLVMQGMLVAFKTEAFYEAGGFAADNLIEDYEITANLKMHGWDVCLANKSWAKTEVPENIHSLWRQRVRWSYGGLTVLEKYGRSFVPVLQDAIGHGMFLALFGLVVLSFLLPRPTSSQGHYFIEALIILSLIQFSVSYLFSVYVMKFYRDVDWKDRLIRLAILPEFLYSNFLTLVMLGSYLFYVYNKLFRKIRVTEYFYKKGLVLFNKLGYSLSWGTRQ